MPKLRMTEVRRRQLIEATFATVERHGLADTTMQRVAREAGLSTAIIHHYFADKDALLAATMRSLLAELKGDVVARLAAAPDARERVRAVLAACFAPEQFRPALITAWLAFWAHALHAPDLARLRRLYDRRMRANLLSALRELLPPRDAERVATTLAATVDGLWLRAVGGAPAIDAAEALAHLEAYLDLELASASVDADVGSAAAG